MISSALPAWEDPWRSALRRGEVVGERADHRIEMLVRPLEPFPAPYLLRKTLEMRILYSLHSAARLPVKSLYPTRLNAHHPIKRPLTQAIGRDHYIAQYAAGYSQSEIEARNQCYRNRLGKK